MQFSRHNTAQGVSLHVARIVVAALLVFALLAGSAPPVSLSFASASECSMSCCVGLPSHPAGECASVLSCHVELPEQHEASDAPQAAHVSDMAAAASHEDHSAHGDVVGDHGVAHHPAAESPTTAAAAHDASHSAHAETHQAQTASATQSEATHGGAAASSSQPTSTPNSTQADAQQPRRLRASIARTALASPCPPDCGMAASSFINVLRSRDAATLTGTHRPRPPTGDAVRTHASDLPLTFSAGKYRLAPPRAPPTTTAL